MELTDYGSGSVEVMFLMFEGQDSTCSCFIPPLLFISKAHECSHTQNFTVKRTLSKIYTSVSIEISLIVVIGSLGNKC